jgi:hypothetical protein
VTTGVLSFSQDRDYDRDANLGVNNNNPRWSSSTNIQGTTMGMKSLLWIQSYSTKIHTHTHNNQLIWIRRKMVKTKVKMKIRLFFILTEMFYCCCILRMALLALTRIFLRSASCRIFNYCKTTINLDIDWRTSMKNLCDFKGEYGDLDIARIWRHLVPSGTDQLWQYSNWSFERLIIVIVIVWSVYIDFISSCICHTANWTPFPGQLAVFQKKL